MTDPRRGHREDDMIMRRPGENSQVTPRPPDGDRQPVRRTLAVPLMGVWADAGPAGVAAEGGFELAVVPGGGEHAPVDDAGTDERGAEPVGLADGPGGHEPAVAPPGDAEPVGVGDASGDEQVDAGEDVGPLLLADPRSTSRPTNASGQLTP